MRTKAKRGKTSSAGKRGAAKRANPAKTKPLNFIIAPQISSQVFERVLGRYSSSLDLRDGTSKFSSVCNISIQTFRISDAWTHVTRPRNFLRGSPSSIEIFAASVSSLFLLLAAVAVHVSTRPRSICWPFRFSPAVSSTTEPWVPWVWRSSPFPSLPPPTLLLPPRVLALDKGMLGKMQRSQIGRLRELLNQHFRVLGGKG